MPAAAARSVRVQPPVVVALPAGDVRLRVPVPGRRSPGSARRPPGRPRPAARTCRRTRSASRSTAAARPARSRSTHLDQVVPGHLDPVLAGDQQQVPEAAPGQQRAPPRSTSSDGQRPAGDRQVLGEAAVRAAGQAVVGHVQRGEEPDRPAEPAQRDRPGRLAPSPPAGRRPPATAARRGRPGPGPSRPSARLDVGVRCSTSRAGRESPAAGRPRRAQACRGANAPAAASTPSDRHAPRNPVSGDDAAAHRADRRRGRPGTRADPPRWPARTRAPSRPGPGRPRSPCSRAPRPRPTSIASAASRRHPEPGVDHHRHPGLLDDDLDRVPGAQPAVGPDPRTRAASPSRSRPPRGACTAPGRPSSRAAR